VVSGVGGVASGRMGVMRRLLVMASFVVFGGFTVMAGCVGMMLRSLLVMLCRFFGHGVSLGLAWVAPALSAGIEASSAMCGEFRAGDARSLGCPRCAVPHRGSSDARPIAGRLVLEIDIGKRVAVCVADDVAILAELPVRVIDQPGRREAAGTIHLNTQNHASAARTTTATTVQAAPIARATSVFA
jgi:hypothetical protein